MFKSVWEVLESLGKVLDILGRLGEFLAGFQGVSKSFGKFRGHWTYLKSSREFLETFREFRVGFGDF